jgi:glycine/D-amino acid oxidase-like deaminating enzyme
MLNPAKLTKSMVKALPSNIQVYENTKLLKWNSDNKIINCFFENASIKTSNIIFCTNGFLKSLNVSTNYSFPLLLTASMTRPLTNDEFNYIGKPKEWGVLSVRPMGATVRLTADKRILIRNTAEVSSSSTLAPKKIQERKLLHQNGIIKRFPSLPKDIIASTWSGIVCRSGNAAQIFQKRNNNVFIAGCYNGSGLGLGTLFGEQIANKACGYETEEIKLIEKKKKPNWLPPEPFLSLGVRLRLMRDRFRAKSDI